jgi:hypothetical protein
MSESKGDILLYQTEDKQTRIQVRLEGETVWLSQIQMAELFQTTVANINIHLRNLYEDQELQKQATIKDYLIVQQEGTRQISRTVTFYNLDVIISVGYRVKSLRGTQFRIWATQRLKEYIVKGFTLDDERLKEVRGLDYFEELLTRVRAIRASERRFYQKITDIYSTSIDYEANTQQTQEFFASVQNKFHWAITGRTAAEIIHERADANKQNMGLTTFKGQRVRRDDVATAKNYLSESEMQQMNLIVDQYLSFAEFQAQQRKPMHMADWRRKLDDFLKLNERDVLTHAGKISAKLAEETAHKEFDKFQERQKQFEAQNPVSDFDQAIERLKKLSAPESEKKKKKPDSL